MDYPTLSSLREGQDGAWEQLSAVLTPKIRAAIQFKLFRDDRPTTQDLESQVFSWLVKKVAGSQFRNIQHLEARAIIKARSVTIDHIRRESRTPRPAPADAPQDLGGSSESGEGGPETDSTPLDALAERELEAVLLNLLGTIKPERREILRIVYLEGFTQQETADRLGKPVGTVGVECVRGLKDVLTEVRRHPSLLKELKENVTPLRLTLGIAFLAMLLR